MWLIFSQISALAESLVTLLAKKGMAQFNSIVVTWVWVTTSSLLLAVVVAVVGIPEIKSGFVTILLLRIILDTVALLLYTKAIHLGEITVSVPLINFSAVFSLLFSTVINGELPGLVGISGVLLVVVGAYLLNWDSSHKDFWQPIRSLANNKGSRYMFLSAILYGVIFSISKQGIEYSSTLFYTFAAAVGLSLTILPIALWSSHKDVLKVLKPRNLIAILPLGLIDVVKILGLMYTISLTYVGYADAANNTSIIYNLALGKVFLKEKIAGRIIPALLMFAGVVLIVIG